MDPLKLLIEVENNWISFCSLEIKLRHFHMNGLASVLTQPCLMKALQCFAKFPLERLPQNFS